MDGPSSLRCVQPLRAPLKLALLLAHERSKGVASRWHPYISMLATPPCSWALTETNLSAAVASLGARKFQCSSCATSGTTIPALLVPQFVHRWYRPRLLAAAVPWASMQV